MEIDNGALSFKMIIDNTDLDKMTKVVEDKIIGMTKNVENNSKAFEAALSKIGLTYHDAFDSTTLKEFKKSIDSQKVSVQELEKQYLSAKIALDNLGDSGEGKIFSNEEMRTALQEYEKAKKMVSDSKKELDSENKILKERETAYTKIESELSKLNNKQNTHITQLRNIREEMIGLEIEGKKESPRYRELQVELEKTGTAYRKVQEEQKHLTTAGSATISGLLSGMSAVSGVFSAGSGIMSLFVDDNKRLAAIQTKLQAAMAITIGLQQVSTALHSTSAFRINVVTKVTQAWKNAQMLLNTQLGMSLALSKGLMIGGIGLLIAGIVALTVVYNRWNDKQKEKLRLLEEEKKFQREVNSSIREQTTKVELLERILRNSNRTYNERNRALEMLKSIMPEYNAQLSKEGKLIEDNTGATKRYIEQLLNAERAKRSVLKAADASDQLDELNAKPQFAGLSNIYGDLDKEKDWAIKNGAFYLGKYKEERKKIDADIKKWHDAAEKYTADDIVKIEDNTKAYWEAKQKQAKARLDGMKDFEKGSKAWNAAQKDFNIATNKLKTWDKTPTKSANQLATLSQKKIEADQWLLNKQKELSNEQIKAGLESEQKVLDLQKDSYEKRKAQNELNYRKELQSIKEFEANKTKAQQEAAKKIYTSEHGGDDKGFDFSKLSKEDLSKTMPVGLRPEDIKEQVAKLTTEVQAAWENADKLAYDEMAKEFMSFQQQKLEVTKTYDDLITQYQDMGLGDRVALLKKERDLTLGELSAMEIQTSDLWKNLFQNMDNLSEKTIKDIMAKLRELVNNIEDVDIKNALTKQLDDVDQSIGSKNPFSAFKKSIKDYKKASDEASKNKAMKNIGESAKSMSAIVTESFGAVVKGLKDLGMMDEETEKILGDVMNLVSSLGDAADGIARLSAGDITAAPQAIAGVVGTITSAFSLFDSKSRDIERKIKAHKKQLIELGRVYKDIEYQVNNAVGEDYYTKQREAIENLRRQQKEVEGLLYQESRKKKKNRDDDAINGYKDQLTDIPRQIKDIEKEITETLVQTSFKDLSNQLADVLVSAFEAGEDAAKEFDKTFNKVIASAVKNSLKMKILEPTINKFTQDLANHMANNGNSASGFNFESWRKELETKGKEFSAGMEEFMKYFDVKTDDIISDPLTGAAKSVTEETASALAGQISMMRIKQADLSEFIRGQLYNAILRIANNSDYNKHLEAIDNTLKDIKSDKGSNSLRAKGL